MNILAADDEALALDLLTEAIEEAAPTAHITSFQKPSKLLEYIAEHPCDVAFLDINMRGVSGLEIAKKLKKLNPEVNIIFVTGYDDYTGDAMMMHASGYIMKPVTTNKVQKELKDLRHAIEEPKTKLLKAKCFGNFEVYSMDGEMLHFERSKSKEALAYLIYRSGASCSTKEIAAALFEDSEYDKNQRGYVYKIITSMIATLKKVGADSVIVRKYNSLAVNIEMIDCDFFDFANRDTTAVNSYLGEFMTQYSWAESAVEYLEELFWNNQES